MRPSFFRIVYECSYNITHFKLNYLKNDGLDEKKMRFLVYV